MINPNKEYKLTQIAEITAIEDRSYLPMFTVKYKNGGLEYKGFIKNIPNFKRFKVGDKVKCRATFSIVGDKFLITSMRKVNKE